MQQKHLLTSKCIFQLLLRFLSLAFFLAIALHNFGQATLCPDGKPARPWFLDKDGDGFHVTTTGSTLLCKAPGAQWVDQTQGYDCDDWKVMYEDGDGDGHGSTKKAGCSYIYKNDDCDDGNKKVHKLQQFYKDKDGDSYGDPSDLAAPVCASIPPSGSVANQADCNDKNGEARTQGEKYYAPDKDRDGLGDKANRIDACTVDKRPAGYVDNTNDCNDKNKDARLWGVRFYYRDFDRDKFGSKEDFDKVDACHKDGTPPLYDDARPANFVDNNLDCNDINGEVKQKGKVFYYLDDDGDGAGSKELIDKKDACNHNVIPKDYVRNNDDCNDELRAVIKENTSFYYADTDSDGYGDPRAKLDWCQVRKGQPACFVVDNQDEDDNALTFIDADCDGWGGTTKTNKRANRVRPNCVANNDGDTNDTDFGIRPPGAPIKKDVIPCKLPPPPYRAAEAERLLTERVGPEVFLLRALSNPVGASLQVQYQLPQPASVRIGIVDALGREVALVFEGRSNAGIHQVQCNTQRLSVGTYILRLQASGGQETFIKTLRLVKAK